MKTCFKCQEEKPLTDFYKHPKMADGLLGKCKECTKNDAGNHRSENIERLRDYDRSRANNPSRVAARKAYAETERGKAAINAAKDRYIERNAAKRKAHNAIANAIRDKKLTPLPCFVCGETVVEGHHPDYDKPLAVVWLCVKHHKQLHREHKEQNK